MKIENIFYVWSTTQIILDFKNVDVKECIPENIFLVLSNRKLKISGLQTFKMKRGFWI